MYTEGIRVPYWTPEPCLQVVRAGRPFLRRMIDLLYAVHRPASSRVPLRLNQGFRADLALWTEFVGCWNGISFLHPPSSLPKTHLFTDASGSWGCAAWHGDAWFQVKWDARAELLSITEKELIPIVLACQAWGSDRGSMQVVSATLTIKQWLLTCDPGLVDTKG